MPRATIYDIARIANVSASTVSRVINNKPTVKPQTRERILQILKENNYLPNETARSLVMHSSRIVGILISDIRTTHHTDGIYYMQREFSENNYSCLIYNTGRDETDWPQYFQSLGQRKVDAAILMGSIYQSQAVRDAIQLYLPNTPVVLCNGCLEGPNIYSLLVNEQEGVFNCVRHLHERGYKHPAFLYNQSTPSNESKRRGFEEGLAHFYPDCERIVEQTGHENHEIYDTTRRVLTEHPEIDSLVFSEDNQAFVGFRAITDLNRRIPDDIGVVGINNSAYAEMSIPTLTSLDNVLYDMSTTAVRNILALLSGQRISKKVIISTELVTRQST